MACNIRGELHYAPAAGCTAYAIKARGTRRREMIVGQNSDMGSEVIPLAYVLRLQPQNKPEVLTYTFGGMLGYHGFNSLGVSKFENALGGGPPSQFGMPHYPVERMMYECRNLEEVFALLRKMSVEYSVNYLMCDGQGNIADIESTTEGPQILRDPGAGYLVHTNHYLSERFATTDNFKRSLPDSFPRLERIHSLIETRYGSITVDDIEHFLSDHSGYATSICRHDKSMRTVASLVAIPAQRRMHGCGRQSVSKRLRNLHNVRGTDVRKSCSEPNRGRQRWPEQKVSARGAICDALRDIRRLDGLRRDRSMPFCRSMKMPRSTTSSTSRLQSMSDTPHVVCIAGVCKRDRYNY